MAISKERRATPRKPTSAATSAPKPPRTPDGASPKGLSNEDLYKLIQETAYFKAKARNFAPGGEVQDWIEAEAEVRRRIGVRAPQPS